MFVSKEQTHPDNQIEMLNIEHSYEAYHGWTYLEVIILK